MRAEEQTLDLAPVGSSPSGASAGSWSDRYGVTHQLRRVTDFPRTMRPPQRIRIYARREHYLLQWWDRHAKRTLNERVDGDLVDALARARELDARLEHFKSAGQGIRKLKHVQLVDSYVGDLQRRADAGELAVATVARYAAALAHYGAFAQQPLTERAYPYAASIDRDFQLGFAAYLEHLQITPNGHAQARRRPLRGQQFVVDAARAMYQWAADPSRGNLLPAGFRSPFQGRGRARRRVAPDQFGEPEITVAMAVDFLSQCDAFQLRLFAPLILYGLRAAEPTIVFREHVDDAWFKVVCLPGLGYLTKGRRDKRFPLVPSLQELLLPVGAAHRQGLLYTRRGLGGENKQTPLLGATLETLIAEFERRCAREAAPTARQRQQVRGQVLDQAGGMNYDHLQAEFARLARRLHWPVCATLKDFRHLFSTCLENAGMPEYYRRYLMGQSAGKAPIVTYTHLNELRQRFDEALEREFLPIVQAIEQRREQLR